MILCVGPTGSGKSSLLKALQLHGNTVPPKTPSIDTIPTCGTNLVEVTRQRVKKNQTLPLDCVTIREVGGGLAPLWHSYIEPGRTRALMYVVDASAPETLGTAALHLIELLAQPGLENAPALVVFSKTDSKPGSALTLREIQALMRVDAMGRQRRNSGIETAEFNLAHREELSGKVYDWCLRFSSPKQQTSNSSNL